MGSRVFLLVIVLCVFSYESESYLYGNSIKIIERKQPSPEQLKLSCECNKDVTMDTLNVSLPTVLDVFANKTACYLDASHTRICELFKQCENCIAEVEQCELIKEPKNELNWNCRLFTYKLNTIRNSRTNTSLTDAKNLASSRQRRAPHGCAYPTSLGESILKHTFYHSGIKITQKCKYGFTLSNGISRVYRCRYDENVWFPEEFPFEDCRPFIHCEIALKYHGTAKCVTATIDVSPVCQISCPHYEDKPAVGATSKCDIDGLWKPDLPHCAQQLYGDKLVPAPKIKLHYLEAENSKGLKNTSKKLEEELYVSSIPKKTAV